jgi:hypothetical protein
MTGLYVVLNFLFFEFEEAMCNFIEKICFGGPSSSLFFFLIILIYIYFHWKLYQKAYCWHATKEN